jgi:ubiquinone/menaquinone biosynthesis C-methylase UbiE
MMNIEEFTFYDGTTYDAYLSGKSLFKVDHETDIDVAFWLERVKECGGPVLELGCGTGRVAIPLREAGFSVGGMDFSESMLAQARKKSDRVEWIQEDIRNFKLDRKFHCIISPYYSLNYCHTIEDIEAVFKNCKAHLSSEGKLIFDLIYLSAQFLQDLFDEKGVRKTVRKFIDPQTQEEIEVKCEEEYSFTGQIHSEIMHYHFSNGKIVSERLDHRIYFPKEIEAILKYNGFKIERCFGNYDSSAFSENSPHHIFVCSHLES